MNKPHSSPIDCLNWDPVRDCCCCDHISLMTELVTIRHELDALQPLDVGGRQHKQVVSRLRYLLQVYKVVHKRPLPAKVRAMFTSGVLRHDQGAV